MDVVLNATHKIKLFFFYNNKKNSFDEIMSFLG